jgi:hypothetical protein
MKIRWAFLELFLCTEPGEKKREKLSKGAPKNVKGAVQNVHRIAKKSHAVRKICLQTLTLAT